MKPGKRMRIDIEEHPDAPEHRRWRATVQLADGSEHETFHWNLEGLFRRVRVGAWIEATCAHPGCDEPCTDHQLCRGCRAYVCDLHDGDVMGAHVLEDHWAT